MKKTILTICLTVFTLLAFAQKYRPMMDDVLRLNELLHKDYSLVNLDLYDEEIMKDEQEVLSRLKAYSNITSSPAKGINKDTSFLITTKKNLLIETEKYEGYKRLASITYKSGDTNLFTENANRKVTIVELKEKIRKTTHEIVKIELLSIQDSLGSDNDFLDTIISGFVTKYDALNDDNNDELALPATNASSKKSLIGLGGAINFDVIIGGLVNFIAKRFKEELANQLFDRLKNTLQDTTITEMAVLKTMLPRTHNFLVSIEEYNLPKLYNEFKQNIEYDLNHFAEQVYNLKKIPAITNVLDNNYQAELAFEGFWLYNQMLVMNNPVDLISKIETMPVCLKWDNLKNAKNIEDSTKKYNIANSLKLISLLSNSLTVTNGESRAWINAEDFKRNIKNENFYYLYFGLLLQQDRNYFNVKFKNINNNSVVLNASINNLFGNYNGLKSKFELVLFDFIDAAEIVNNQVTQVSKLKKQNVPISSDTIYNLLSASINVIDKAAALGDSLVSFINPDLKMDFKSVQNYIGYARTGAEVYKELGNENYVMAFMLVLEKLNSTFSNSNTKIKPDIFESLNDSIIKGKKYMKKIRINETNIADTAKFDNKKNDALTALSGISVILNKVDLQNPTDLINKIESLILKITYFKNSIDSLGLKYYSNVKWFTTFDYINNFQFPDFKNDTSIKLISPKTHEILNFVLGLATAKTDEEAAKVIEKAAVPAGSYSIKNKSICTISLNSYVGFFAAEEYSVFKPYSWKFNYGFTVPVGFSVNMGFRNGKGNAGWFLSLIDIGALVSFRLSDSTESTELPEFDYRNLFAPGVHFVINPINNFPLTIGIGFQKGPNMISYKTTPDEKYSGWRIDGFLAVDIPIFYLSKKTRFLK